MLITPETGQNVVENMLLVAKVEEHGDEQVVVPLEITPDSTCNKTVINEIQVLHSSENLRNNYHIIQYNIRVKIQVLVQKLIIQLFNSCYIKC